MADQLVTQVQRPALSIEVNPDEEEKAPDAALDLEYSDVKNDDEATPRTSSGRYKALSRMFSRQYTPTIPKKTMFNEKEERRNDMEVIEEDTPSGKSLWRRLGSVFQSEDSEENPLDDGPIEMLEDEYDSEEEQLQLELVGILVAMVMLTQY